jgi:hypothetical protein
MSQDMRPCRLAKHKEHQHIQQPQKINVDRTNAIILVGTMKDY